MAGTDFKPDPALDRMAVTPDPPLPNLPPRSADKSNPAKDPTVYFQQPNGAVTEIPWENLDAAILAANSAITVDPGKDQAFRKDTAARMHKVAETTRTMLARIDKNPALKKAFGNVARVTGCPLENLVSLSVLESSGGVLTANSASSGTGVFQFTDSTYYDSIHRFAQTNMNVLNAYAPEAAQAFRKTMDFIKFDPDRRKIVLDDLAYQKKYPGHTIKQDLAPYKDNYFVQGIFAVAQARGGHDVPPAQLALANNYGRAGADLVLNAAGGRAIGTIISTDTLARNSVDPGVSIEAFRERLVNYYAAVTGQAREQLADPVQVAEVRAGKSHPAGPVPRKIGAHAPLDTKTLKLATANAHKDGERKLAAGEPKKTGTKSPPPKHTPIPRA